MMLTLRTRWSSMPTALRWAVASGIVQSALWFGANVYIVYSSFGCEGYGCFASYALLLVTPATLAQLLLVARAATLHSLARKVLVVLEVCFELVSLLFLLSLVGAAVRGELTNVPGFAPKTIFVVMSVALPIVVIVSLMRSRRYF